MFLQSTLEVDATQSTLDLIVANDFTRDYKLMASPGTIRYDEDVLRYALTTPMTIPVRRVFLSEIDERVIAIDETLLKTFPDNPQVVVIERLTVVEKLSMHPEGSGPRANEERAPQWNTSLGTALPTLSRPDQRA